MPWVKLDDGAPDHPKLAVLSPEAFTLWIRALCYCSRHHLDGRLPKGAIKVLCPSRQRSSVVEELLAAPLPPFENALWIDRGEHFEIHDYLEYQPSKSDIEAMREQARERQDRWRRRKRNAVTNAVTDAVSNGKGDALVTPTTHYPLKSNTLEQSSTVPAEPPAAARKLSPQQRAVGRILELYQAFDVEPPKPSLLGQWLKRCNGDVAAILARLQEVMLAGRLQEVEQPTAFAAKVIGKLAEQLQRGQRPAGAEGFEEGERTGPPESQRSLLRAVLTGMRSHLAADEDQERSAAEAELRELFGRAGWEWVPPTAERAARLEAWLYPQGGPS